MSNIVIEVPDITGVTITPNPTNLNTSITISLVVTEKTIILEPEDIYSGEMYSGEDDWI